MQRTVWAFVVPLLAAIPAVGLEKPLVPQRDVIIQPVHPTDPGQGGVAYKAPELKDGVVELLDEGVEPLFPLLINDGGGEPGSIAREDRDVFAGVESVRVTPLQKYRTALPGWNFKVVENPKLPPGPKAPVEIRYLRFAWKKSGGPGIMIQFHDPVKSWSMRYFAGQNAVAWTPAISVSAKLPGDWELVTRDLFKEHGAFTITGMALTAMYGDSDFALFDHMLLGQSIQDLDRATDGALGRIKPGRALAGKERESLWADLLGTNRHRATAAIRAFLASAPDQVAFIGAKLAKPDANKDISARIRKLAADLNDDDFDVREAATAELIKIGTPALDVVRTLATNNDNDEVRYRARMILKKLKAEGTPLSPSGKMSRVVRVLERAGSADARSLLKRMADGEFGFDGATDARAALGRLTRNR
jgi:hypothetical protein